MPLHIEAKGDFLRRHLGPRDHEIREMLETLGSSSLSELAGEAIPAGIRSDGDPAIDEAVPEAALLERLSEIAAENRVCRSFIGMGYSGTILPPVIQRNILENPGWYTQYTPYQAEIAQGRLEALLNFQTMVIDLTGLEIANASLLDEGTAAAEAMTLFHGETRDDERNVFFVSELCHPQTIEVVRTRAEPVGVEVVVGDHASFEFGGSMEGRVFGALLQYPATDGAVLDYSGFCDSAHDAGALVVVATDLLSLTLLTPPGEFGADVAVGSSQRFGVPEGYGGPHAAFISTREEFKRKIPGRIIGVSVDADGNRALRMALQTREQHIRREKATSNICTAQVLLAVIAGMYAVYHGAEGLTAIARRVHGLATVLAEGLRQQGHEVLHPHFFDTLRIRPDGQGAGENADTGGGQRRGAGVAPAEGMDREGAARVFAAAQAMDMNLRDFGDGTVGVALDERTAPEDVDDLLAAFAGDSSGGGSAGGEGTALRLAASLDTDSIPSGMARTTPFMEHPVFQRYQSETEMLRYMHRLESRDLALNTSMIPLGSCTMKLNATTQMMPITWSAFSDLHPFAPMDQAAGYHRIIGDLEEWLAEITGFDGVSLQPNSGAQGEYAGLLVIRAYQKDRGEGHRRVCLIPSSAHGTNPASAVMAGMQVKVVRCDENGNIDLDDLRAKAEAHADELSALMVTYPSTHGVFEEHIREVCDVVHANGGQVYLDGANLNAQVGLCRPADYGADVCHINLHKTFAIPHGGGGPGMGPICTSPHLTPFLPGHPVVEVGGEKAIGPISAAPWGSSSILIISWAYIALLGREGVRRATEVAILNANYMARRLEDHFDVLFRGAKGRVAHEFILDLRPFRKSTGVTEEDVAKRLIDYGFHAPTMSWPVPGTIMIEPTESESKAELDRFCDALISIRAEIQQIEMGIADREDNALRNAPHTAESVVSSEWDHPYSREQAAFPAAWTRDSKFWPAVRRVDNAYGDRNLICACPPIEEYA